MWQSIIFCLFSCKLSVTTAQNQEPTCQSDSFNGPSCQRDNFDEMDSKQASYFWPTAHGHWKHYHRSPYIGPFNLSAAVAWSWHPPNGEYSDMLLGSSMDDKKNIYVMGDQAAYKLNPDGKLLWTYVAPNRREGNFHPNAIGLYGGVAYFNSLDGRLFAVDMETGKEIWIKQVGGICGDTGWVSVYAGYVIFHGTPEQEGGGERCREVKAVNASDGTSLWAYAPDNPVWDLMVDFVGDGTFVFQDLTGRGYRNYLANGTNIWKNGGSPNSWTDGTQALGPNGLVYTVNANGCGGGGGGCTGTVSAHRVSDGEVAWKYITDLPPNVAPSVGELREGEGLSVVVPTGPLNDCAPAAFRFWGLMPFLGKLPESVQYWAFIAFQTFVVWLGDRQQMLFQNPDQASDVYVFNAETGQVRWKWIGPVYKRTQTIGDEKGTLERMGNKIRSASCPALPAPRVGGDGIVYLQNKNGYFYAIKDFNGDGRIDPETEVSSFNCEHDFSSIGSAHAPGMVVATSGGKVWAFKS